MALGRSILTGAAVALSVASGAAAQECGDARRAEPLAPTDLNVCRSLAETVRDPSALPLNDYEAALSTFFDNWCHRNAADGWVRDKRVRDTGPFTAALTAMTGRWERAYHGTHEPVVIWYSGEMADWLIANRPAEGNGASDPPPIPDGAIMVKEMFPAPAAACAGTDPELLFPTNGAAIMVRDSDGAYDGWFWGWYGWGDSGWKPDWPADDRHTPPLMGFGQYCMNCHASARDMTFSDTSNLNGQPGEPLVFLSQDFDFATRQVLRLGSETAAAGQTAAIEAASIVSSSVHSRAAGVDPPSPGAPGSRDLTAGVLGRLGLPSQRYDNVWTPAQGPHPGSQYLTSDQCLGCHDAGSTGLQFDMTVPDRASASDVPKLLNFSPYATWRTSPMGLAGRDPVFFAQMASETQTFHPDESDSVQTICLGCHGIQGERQFQIDTHQRDGTCGTFDTAMVHAVPYPPSGPSAMFAAYGALARDGVSCMTCHHMVLGDAATEQYADTPQNACVLARQNELNPDETGFARTFTGSFLVGPADELYGPFADPRTRPMEHALGITPMENDAISTSELCGTCHTVHLPVLHEGEVIGRVYEQTTYPEWAFSAYRTGATVDGPLPEGPGPLAESCQGCHMASGDETGQFVSKIASIQEYSNFPEAEHRLPRETIDLEPRTGFAKHTLVGLNIFLVEMFRQNPELLGIPTEDPMLVSRGLEPLELTEREILDQAARGTAAIAIVGQPGISGGILAATVKIDSLTGHKFPSGVGFRRAFVSFEVLDRERNAIWVSGRPRADGVLVGADGDPIDGEVWWDEDCTARLDPETRAHQEHYEVIRSQDQAQIYQELVSTPPLGGPLGGRGEFQCGHHAPARGQLTTSFLSICAEVKDNRLPPPGYLDLESRAAIAAALGAGRDLAEDAGFTAVGDDPDYAGPTETGGDTLRYEIRRADIDGEPAFVRATLFYQAVPPFYLQDRYCTGAGADTDRLEHIVSDLDLENTAAENWSLEIVATDPVPLVK